MRKQSQNEYDVIVVGGGVVGTFHAWFALKMGLRTLLIERNETPRDGSVRNFGTLVPSAMTEGLWLKHGLNGVAQYKEISKETGYPINPNGTVYLSFTPNERKVLEEMRAIGPAKGYNCELLEPGEALKQNPAVDVEKINGALFFPDDLRIESRQFFEFLLPWMEKNLGLVRRMGTVALNAKVSGGACQISTAIETFSAQHAIICSGGDFRTLLPDVFAKAGLQRCMLHMMRTEPMPQMVPSSLMSGLSLRWYSSFEICPSWSKLAEEPIDPVTERDGIHIILVQDADGGVVIGDSHEYTCGDFEERFRSSTEAAIIREAQKMVRFPHWRIAERWLGIYPKHPERALYEETVDERIHIVTGVAGKGMTCGPSIAQGNINRLFGKA